MTLPKVVTWRHVNQAVFPNVVRMAGEAGFDTTGWHLSTDDVPILVLTNGSRYCAWSNARGCAEYLQAWTDLLAVLAWTKAERDAVVPPCTHFKQHGTYCEDSACQPCMTLAVDAVGRNDKSPAGD